MGILYLKANGQAMKRALDQENRDDALKYAQQMLATLGPPPPTAPMLSPQMYYGLYNSCFDQLRLAGRWISQVGAPSLRSTGTVQALAVHAAAPSDSAVSVRPP